MDDMKVVDLGMVHMRVVDMGMIVAGVVELAVVIDLGWWVNWRWLIWDGG